MARIRKGMGGLKEAVSRCGERKNTVEERSVRKTRLMGVVSKRISG